MGAEQGRGSIQNPDPRYRSSVHRSCTDQGTSSRGHAANGFRTIKNRKQSLVTDAMVLLSKTLHASWSIGLAAALVAAIPPGIARAENIVGGAFASHLLDAAASEGAFRHLRALQDIASDSGGNRAAGTLGYDRSAEYVAERRSGRRLPNAG
jgi:hypothetical protein